MWVFLFPPHTICISLCFKVPCAASEEAIEWCKGIYIPSEQGSWSIRFHLLLRAGGVVPGVCPIPLLKVQEGTAPALLRASQRCGTGQGHRCQAVRDANSHLHREGCTAKPLHRASLVVWGPQTGSSTAGTLASGLGVSSSEGSRPKCCCEVKEEESR